MDLLLLSQPLGVIPVLINPIAVLLSVLPGIFMALVSLLKPKSLKALAIMIWKLKLPIAGIALAGYGLRLGFLAVFPPTVPELAAAEAGEQNWPHFRGDIKRQGWVQDGSPDPVTGGVNWTFREGNNQWFIASPAVVGNRVYIPSVTVTAFGALSGSIYALDADTGALVWRVTPPNYDGSFSSASVYENFLLVGEGLHITKDARMFCIDISDEQNPEILWSFRTNSHIEGTPTIDQGRVFFTAGDDGIYGLDLRTGEKLWHLPGDEFNDPETSILAHDGKVYIGLGFGLHGQAIVQVDAATGEVLHRISTPYPVFGPPSIHDGVVYFGMGNGDFVFSAEDRVEYVLDILRRQGLSEAELTARRATLGPGGAVWALDIETMETLWTFPTDRSILSAVTVNSEGLYFASRTGGIYHLDFQGRQLAYWNTGAPVLASLALTEEHVYVMSSHGMLHVLRADDLTPVWDLRLGTGTMFFSSPAIARGQIFVGTETGGMMSVGEPDFAGRVVLWNGDGGGPRRAGRSDDAPLPAFGALKRNLPESAMGDTADRFLERTPLIAEETMVTAWTLPAPHLRGEHSQGSWTRDLPGEVKHMARRNDLLAAEIGGETPMLKLLTLEDGHVVASLPLPADLPALLQATADGFWYQESPESYTLINELGEVTARTATPPKTAPPIILPNFFVALNASQTHVQALDRPTGKLLWETPLSGVATGELVLDDQRILIPTDTGLRAYELHSGRPVAAWEAPAEAIAGPIAMDRSEIVAVTANGELLRLLRTQGREIGRSGPATPGFQPLLERNRIFWIAEGEMKVLARDELDPRPVTWVDFSWMGAPTTGLLARRSELFLGVEGWGLVTFGEEQ